MCNSSFHTYGGMLSASLSTVYKVIVRHMHAKASS